MVQTEPMVPKEVKVHRDHKERKDLKVLREPMELTGLREPTVLRDLRVQFLLKITSSTVRLIFGNEEHRLRHPLWARIRQTVGIIMFQLTQSFHVRRQV